MQSLIQRAKGYFGTHFHNALLSYSNTSLELVPGVNVRLQTRGDLDVIKEIFIDGQYDAGISAALELRTSEPLRCLDLGCNIGIFGLRLNHSWRLSENGRPLQIVGVDAAPYCLKRCAFHLEALDPSCFDHKLIHGLVGKRAGTSSFMVRSQNHLASRISDRGLRTLEMHYLDLAELVQNTGEFHFIKCDIEGSEGDLISSYPEILALAQVISMELHGSQMRELASTRIAGLGFTRTAEFQSGENAVVTFVRST